MKLFLQTYYILLFFVLYRQTNNFINNIPSIEPEYIFFAKFLSFLSLPIEAHSVIFVFALFFCLFSIFKSWRILRVFTSLFVLVLFSIKFSYGKVHHPWDVWILSSILVCLFNSNKPLNSNQNFFLLRFIQGALLSHYFMSGLWKIRAMCSTHFEFSLSEIATEYIAFNLHSQNMHFILKFSLEHPFLLGVSYFCVLLFQLTALAPIFVNRFFKLYGLLAVLFHFSTGIF